MEFKVGEGFHRLPRRILDVLVHFPRLRHDFVRFSFPVYFERFSGEWFAWGAGRIASEEEVED